jgi:hypothetical protein
MNYLKENGVLGNYVFIELREQIGQKREGFCAC